jgi:hypothetical protein
VSKDIIREIISIITAREALKSCCKDLNKKMSRDELGKLKETNVHS